MGKKNSEVETEKMENRNDRSLESRLDEIEKRIDILERKVEELSISGWGNWGDGEG